MKTTLRKKEFLYLLVLVFVLLNSCKKGDTESYEVNGAIKFNADLNYDTVIDIDGNVYKTIVIGKQIWMAENLRVTHYRNGDNIETSENPYSFSYNNTGFYYYGNFTTVFLDVNIYGRLYNSFAALDSRNIAPVGWHVSTTSDWNQLIEFLGGENIAGQKLKEKGVIHWNTDNGSTNESGFTALPGGQINTLFWKYSRNHDIDGYFGYWWSLDNKNITNLWKLTNVQNISLCEEGEYNIYFLYSLRCVKD